MNRLFGLALAVPFLIVACNRAAEEPPAPEGPQPRAYGTLAQVMQGIPFPASNIIFDAQSTDPGAAAKEGASDPAGQGATATYAGVYGGWVAVENAAIALQETANLIMIPGRTCQNGRPVPTDQADFQMWAQNLAAAGDAALKAARSKNLDAMVDVSGTLSDACAMCHEKYRDTPNQPTDRCTP